MDRNKKIDDLRAMLECIAKYSSYMPAQVDKNHDMVIEVNENNR